MLKATGGGVSEYASYIYIILVMGKNKFSLCTITWHAMQL